jgi:hypothetical protein
MGGRLERFECVDVQGVVNVRGKLAADARQCLE